MESETVHGSIDVGVLSKIYLVAFGSLSVIVLKFSWIQHLNQGRCTIQKDPSGFWTCSSNVGKDATRKNPFILPANASLVFFVEDVRDLEWRVVVFHKPRSRREIGSDAHKPFRSHREETALETPLSEVMESASITRGAPQEVPEVEVYSIDAELSMAVDEAMFEDTQYEEELELASPRSADHLAKFSIGRLYVVIRNRSHELFSLLALSTVVSVYDAPMNANRLCTVFSDALSAWIGDLNTSRLHVGTNKSLHRYSVYS